MAKQNIMRKSGVFHDYYARLKSIAVSVFEWEGLPETCNARFLEDTLFSYGQAAFVNDPTMSYLTLKVTPAGALNVYNEPIAYVAHATGYSQIFDADKMVFIRNNYLAKSTDLTTLIYAERLTRLQMAIDVNINAQKTPLLIRCDEKTKRTLETIYDKYNGDSPVIYGGKAMTDKPLEAISTGAPYVVDKLRDEKRAVWNEYLEYLGIDTNPSDKKRERLIVSEVESNNVEVETQSETMLLCRQEACEKINKLFGLSVSVKRRVSPSKQVESEESENVKIYP